MTLLKVIILAIVQGLAELLPVSSSAHVVVAEKLMGLDPSAPSMTLLLVMLHTGTMFAVIVYFWSRWRAMYFSSVPQFKRVLVRVIIATALTGVIGWGLKTLIEKTVFRNAPHAQIEDLFSHLELIAPALAAAGILILVAGLRENRYTPDRQMRDRLTRDQLTRDPAAANDDLTPRQAGVIGAVQGLCLPFRGFSRSGATISMGMLAGVTKASAENFSFALAVVLTPPVVAREAWRVLQVERTGTAGLAGSGLAGAGLAHSELTGAMVPSLVGAALAFVAGLVALRWLSRWLEGGRWYLFGVYCLIAAGAVAGLYSAGY